jgi:hypothetical protein
LVAICAIALWSQSETYAGQSASIKDLSPGAYVIIRVKNPADFSAQWPLLRSGVIGREFVHKDCKGNVVKRDWIDDSGRSELYCDNCPKVWVTQEGTPKEASSK